MRAEQEAKRPNYISAERRAALGHLQRWIDTSGINTFEQAIVHLLRDGVELGQWKEFSLDAKASIPSITLTQECVIQYGGFVFNRDTRELLIPDGQIVEFTPTEADIFNDLITHAGRQVPKSKLRQPFIIRGMDTKESDINLRIYILYLRRKLKDELISKRKSGYNQWRYISTVTNSGYIFNPDGNAV